MYIKRQIEETILKSSATFPVILLTGPRQTGKSTVLRHLEQPGRTYVTLDNPAIRESARSTPDLFFQRFPPPLILDEIQYAPQLFPYIKMLVDKCQENGLFWLTGSQAFEMMQNVQESLAGRVSLLKMYGFSQAEKEGRTAAAFPPDQDALIALASSQSPKSAEQVFQSIWQGSMPRVVTQPEMDVENYYASYVQTYLERDVRLITTISDEGQFVRFIKLIAARTAQELNLAALAREIGVDAKTCRRWLDILVMTGLVIELPAYSGNLSDRLIKRPKLYFMDTGLAAYLTGWQSAEAMMNGSYSGAVFETWVVSEIMKSWWFNGKRPVIYYYRDRMQKEVDLLISRNQQLLPFEIKKSSNPNDALKNFPVLEKLAVEIGFGGVLSLSPELLPITEKYWQIPVSLL
ncbi:MAG TPA: ATP-binding protein [Anaerolineaceae bacterium]|jgi:predicted AAA+ superfamily ATPase|nr:ATP-binding protein [Anaerolineaceae bacterium]HOE34212.1 ATP-binding protein [Anaerolineaceae bacterium]HOT25209.1 ATP-binding protein [Anaerolineaceae bacterium]HQH57764.1 ATP-binding protein [Anaerolineaceae bacterium]HQK02730.1 ATP-binding protein [Anaerolineaceae bacterium]